MAVKETTLDELVEKIQSIEKVTREKETWVNHLKAVSSQLINAANKEKPVRILTDYDADGICSAYILRSSLKAVNPEVDVKVICNDRRNGYGVPKDIEIEKDAVYIVSDMGSNELDYIFDNLGQDTIVIDHHIIEDKESELSFQSDDTLLNPKAFVFEDGKSADYCATGLAYRCYRTMNRLCMDAHLPFYHSEMLDNTLIAMAAVGTVADCVNLADPYSYNRKIVQRGLEAINNADEKNFDFVFGNFLYKNGFHKVSHAFASDLAFKIAPAINAPSRLSEINGMNGAQFVFDTLTGDISDETFVNVDRIVDMNTQRKELADELKKSEKCRDTIARERESEGGALVYELPHNTPTALAGLVAGELAQETGKMAIVMTYNTDTKSYAGSARNSTVNETSLKEFLDRISENLSADEFKYGGHADACGISYLSEEGYSKFVDLVDKYKGDIVQNTDREVLVISPEESKNADDTTTKKILALEPIGNGWQLPNFEFRGKEGKSSSFIKNNPFWKNIKVKPNGFSAQIDVTDWNYSDDYYPAFADGSIKCCAAPYVRCVNDKFKFEFKAVHDAAFEKDYLKEIEAERSKSKKKDELTNP